MNVSLAHTVYSDLLTAQQTLVLTSDLHLLTLVIPYDLIKTTTPNWVIFYDLVRITAAFILIDFPYYIDDSFLC